MTTLGNPAPLGLICFAMTTLMLMYIDMGWIEKDSEALIFGISMFFGGLVQLLVGILELFKGSSFSFAAFSSYGAFWMSRAAVFMESQNYPETFGTLEYPHGLTAYLIQWGILTFCFWIITLRKNICLIVVFGLLTITFFVLAAAHAQGSTTLRTVAGYFGFFTACGAFYTAIAELINEDYGRNILPGLTPLVQRERLQLTKEVIRSKFIAYDTASNTLFLYFRGFQINTLDDVNAIRDAVVESIEECSKIKKVHCVADYKDVTIGKNILQAYWKMAAGVESKYYLSCRRFSVTSFGTKDHHSGLPTAEGTTTPGDVGTDLRTSVATTNVVSLQEAALPLKSVNEEVESA